MHKTNSILMCAPKSAVFETAANLELWPVILPHYRYIRYLERGPDRNIVVMAARRSGIPIVWTSEQIIDRQNMEVRFHHLKALTKGMRVVWEESEIEKAYSITNVVFIIAPRVNAAGRMDDARKAVEMFISDDPVRAMEFP